MSLSISAYVLAGGQSSRMGQDKGLLMLGDKPVVSYVMTALQKVSDDITIISADEQYLTFGHALISDHYPGKGPASGIDTALQHAKTSTVFICSCDMPFITEQSIANMLRHAEHGDISVCKNEQFIEPMFAIYKKQCKEKWRELLLKGTLRLSDYFSHFDTNFVDSAEMLSSDPHLFFNLNTPQDLILANEWLKK
jgi:molybdopterin-guanine dinucleotide biosynthesis protein A